MSEVYKVAAYVPISAELWEEIDRERHPWKYPDRRVLPMFNLFPRWSKLAVRWREARRRIFNARLALRGHVWDEDNSR